MATIEEMQARLARLKGTSFALTDAERKHDELAREIEKEGERLDEERSVRLQAEARAAYADARSKMLEDGIDKPIDVVWSLNAFKLCGVGWLVLGPEDAGKAAEALRSSGKLDGSGKYKVQEKNPDTCRVVVQRAMVAAPVPKEDLSRALMTAPEFVVACYEKVRDLSGAYLQEVAGKSSG